MPFRRSQPTFLMLALLLATLWVSAAHRHDLGDPHPQTQCSICVQLQSAHFAGGNDLQLPLIALNGQHLIAEPSSGVHANIHSPYQSRAPPTASS